MWQCQTWNKQASQRQILALSHFKGLETHKRFPLLPRSVAAGIGSGGRGGMGRTASPSRSCPLSRYCLWTFPNPRPQTFFQTIETKPSTLDPTPSTLNPTLEALNRTPYIREPCNLNPEIQTPTASPSLSCLLSRCNLESWPHKTDATIPCLLRHWLAYFHWGKKEPVL